MPQPITLQRNEAEQVEQQGLSGPVLPKCLTPLTSADTLSRSQPSKPKIAVDPRR
jgi:hypothetical protein